MVAVRARKIEGHGTPESAWERCEALSRVPFVTFDTLVPRTARLVVIAPHPDDEVLGVGGLLAMHARAAAPALVIGVTNGEASHPGSVRWMPSQLAALRLEESARGLAQLGVSLDVRLGLPDGKVHEHEHQLLELLRARLQPNDIVCSTWRLDGHPDHEATGRAAARAAADAGLRLLEVPIWGWHWADPSRADLPWERALRIPLTDEARAQKARALTAHRSQLEPDPTTGRDAVVPPWVAARHARPWELVIL